MADGRRGALRTIGTTEEQRVLASVAADFARRAARGDGDPRDRRTHIAEGEVPGSWASLVEAGLHAVHLDEEFGGAGAGILELAVIVEQLGAALYTGPLLGSALCSLLVQESQRRSGASRRSAEALHALGAGAVGACAFGGVWEATRVPGGLRITGVSEAVLAAPCASWFLVRVPVGEHRAWAIVPADAPGWRTEPWETVDLTQAVGTLTARSAFVADDQIVTGIDDDLARRVLSTLLGADACGVATRTVELAVEHAARRTQFGTPLARFQAVQHRAARMHVTAERARAIVWDACLDLDGAPDQDRIVAAQVPIVALAGAVENALEHVMMLGAMGFTWEHDAHLLWRRALQVQALCGPRAERERELGVAVLHARRRPAFGGDGALPGLRAEVRDALRRAGDPEEGRIPRSAWELRRGSGWQASLAQDRLVSPFLPEPYGRGADPLEQAVILEEFEAAGVRPPSLVIGDWVLPAVIGHGTPSQVARLVPPTLRSEMLWCQLFSEPEAGSDLAAVSTRAVRVEGGWRIRGQKIWTSLADVADRGALLARTDPESTGRHGLGYFLVDMRSSGVEVRPIAQATGPAEFCEVFLDDVFVPDDDLLGGPADGWRVATTTLSNERLRMGEALGHGGTGRLRELCAEDSDVREPALSALGRSAAREHALGALAARGAVLRMAGLDAGSETSVLKLANIVAQREGSAELLALCGPPAVQGAELRRGARTGALLDHLGLPAVLIGGGTPDIQLGLIAHRILGMR